jgi:hypothetical protein
MDILYVILVAQRSSASEFQGHKNVLRNVAKREKGGRGRMAGSILRNIAYYK